ncbi:hypothetical protein BASA61_003680 [Batrachochytrium salamandrivorans]|nr:hypothetical protein BASA62_000987 [Batrachochytrium salamandrivorans]KAH6595793.1 hypothetical protein BASA61_003680 [Batrachochytrium salamandrivorans]KAH9275674.1 hypothetical protein BASA83_001973 [Batrachochytrium salamandrivorans]
MYSTAICRTAQSILRPMSHQISRHYDTLVSTSWLAKNQGKVILLDGSWHMPSTKRNPFEEFRLKHIQDARFFGIDDISDKSSKLPHMLPPLAQFNTQVGELGITSSDHIVIYDTTGMGSACRVYWTFRSFGHEKVSVLDGGLPKWLADGHPTVSGDTTVEPAVYSGKVIPEIIANFQRIEKTMMDHDCQIVDARPAGRFYGSDPEPRAGLSSGHIPESRSMPSVMVFDPSTKDLLSPADLRKLCESRGINLDRPIICTCGSGVTASILYFAFERAGAKELAVYDGSWTEYASTPNARIGKINI